MIALTSVLNSAMRVLNFMDTDNVAFILWDRYEKHHIRSTTSSLSFMMSELLKQHLGH